MKQEAENRIMERRNTLGIDADSRLTDLVNIEAVAIDAINAEENEGKKTLIAKAMGEAVGH